MLAHTLGRIGAIGDGKARRKKEKYKMAVLAVVALCLLLSVTEAAAATENSKHKTKIKGREGHAEKDEQDWRKREAVDPFWMIDRVFGEQSLKECADRRQSAADKRDDDCFPWHHCVGSYGVDWDGEARRHRDRKTQVRTFEGFYDIPAGSFAAADLDGMAAMSKLIADAPRENRYVLFWYNPNFDLLAHVLPCNSDAETERLDDPFCKLLRKRDPRIVHIFATQTPDGGTAPYSKYRNWKIFGYNQSRLDSNDDILTSLPLGIGGCGENTNGRVDFRDVVSKVKRYLLESQARNAEPRPHLLTINFESAGRGNRLRMLEAMNKTWGGRLVNEYSTRQASLTGKSTPSYFKWMQSKFVLSPPGVVSCLLSCHSSLL